jgi:hypothetical protein
MTNSRRQHGRTGYKSPPEHTKFSPGRSGNPHGRPKARVSLQKIVTGVLFEKVDVRLGDRTLRVASVDALVRAAMSRALEGDYKFLMAVIAIIRLSGLPAEGDDKAVADADLTAEDEQILSDFFERRRSAETTTNCTAPTDNRQQNIRVLKRNDRGT